MAILFFDIKKTFQYHFEVRHISYLKKFISEENISLIRNSGTGLGLLIPWNQENGKVKTAKFVSMGDGKFCKLVSRRKSGYEITKIEG